MALGEYSSTLNINRALRHIRQQKGLSQEKLAELAGLDSTFISLIEVGKRNPSYASIEKISNALGIHPWEIVKYVNDNECEIPFKRNLRDALASLLASFDTTQDNSSICLALIELCQCYEFIASVLPASDLRIKDNTKRAFLLKFENEVDAIKFSITTGKTTFGKNSVLLEID